MFLNVKKIYSAKSHEEAAKIALMLNLKWYLVVVGASVYAEEERDCHEGFNIYVDSGELVDRQVEFMQHQIDVSLNLVDNN